MKNQNDTVRASDLSDCYSGIVHDVMRVMGMCNFILPSELKPLIPGQTLCGPAFTIEGHPDDTAGGHETLLAWTGLLTQAKPGHIWVSQPHDNRIAHMGELSAEALQKKGVLGCIVDGGIRDGAFLIDIGFPAWRRFHTPEDVVGRWLPTATEVPIIIGNVCINPGDYLLGDIDGVVRVPKEHIDEVTSKSIESMNTENKVRTAIINGSSPQDAYLKYGKF